MPGSQFEAPFAGTVADHAADLGRVAKLFCTAGEPSWREPAKAQAARPVAAAVVGTAWTTARDLSKAKPGDPPLLLGDSQAGLGGSGRLFSVMLSGRHLTQRCKKHARLPLQ